MVKLQNHIANEVLQARKVPKELDIRGAYYRDTTAIIHSSAFRRLKHKTQVFYAPSNDHICTRIEHVLHVASIATTITRGLGLDNELAWAIGLGHDLGHTPFGHTGEKIISSMMRKRGLGVFEHEVNSLRVIDFLSNQGRGLNLTYAVRDGIVCHNGEQFLRRIKPQTELKVLEDIKSRNGLLPNTYEAAVVRYSDSIAYLGRDYEDAVRLNIIDQNDLPLAVRNVLGSRNADIIDTLVNDIIENSSEEGIGFSDEKYEAIKEMIAFNYSHIYRSPMLAGYEKYFSRLLYLILHYLEDLVSQYGDDEEGYFSEKNMLAVAFCRYRSEMMEKYIAHDGNADRLVFDYLSGMSDNFALDCANEILKPEHLNDTIEQSLTGKWFDALHH